MEPAAEELTGEDSGPRTEGEQMQQCAVQGRGAEASAPSCGDDRNAADPLLNGIGNASLTLHEEGEGDLSVYVARK